MTKKILTMLLAVSSLGALLPSRASAQGGPPQPPPPEMKKTVDAFAGRWAFAGSLTLPDGKAKPLKTKLTCTKAVGGKAVSCIEDGEVVGLGPMHAAYLIGFDTFTKRVHFMAMTSDEAVHDHPCTWKAIKATVILPDGGHMLVDIKGKRS